MFKNYKIYTFFIIIFSLLLVYSIVDYKKYLANRNNQATEEGESLRDNSKDILNKVIDTIENATLDLSKKLSEKKYSKKEIEKLIKEAAIKNAFCLGVTVAFEPVYEDTIKQLFAPFYTKKYDKFEYIENSYDYTDESLETTQWYTGVIKQKKGNWSNPYFAKVAQELVVDYGLPIFQTDKSGSKNVIGMVSFTLSASYITSYLHDATLGEAGFSFIVNKDLYIISHPIPEFLTNPNRAKQIVEKQPIFKTLVNKNEGHFTAFSKVAQEKAEYFFTNLDNNWVVSVVIPKHDLLSSFNLTKKKLVNISIFLTLTLISLFIVLLKVWKGDTQKLWIFSFLVGTLLFLNILFVWYLNTNQKFYESNDQHVKILSTTTIDNYLKERSKELKQIDASLKSVEIPTGVFLYDIDFKNAYDVAIIGKIWQKIPDDFELRNETTFVFPQASATGISVRTRPMGKEHIDGYWIYFYDFNATIQFDFDYLKFPLNYKKLDLQIVYPHVKDNVVLTPDIPSYEFIDSSLKPGISNDIYMPNSKVIESYFSFHEHNFYTNFADNNVKYLENTSVLTFNVLIKNVIISSIISNVIPIFIIAVMVFLLPFTVDKRDGEVKEGGSLNIIQAAGGFFFVLLLAHIQLRNNIETPGFIYLETFYFVMYFMLAIMSASVLIFLKTNKFSILEYKHNLIFKLSYWPFLLFAIYIISLFIFY